RRVSSHPAARCPNVVGRAGWRNVLAIWAWSRWAAASSASRRHIRVVCSSSTTRDWRARSMWAVSTVSWVVAPKLSQRLSPTSSSRATTGVPLSHVACRIASGSSTGRRQASAASSASSRGATPTSASARASASSKRSIAPTRLSADQIRSMSGVEKPGYRGGGDVIPLSVSEVEEHRLVVALEPDVEPVGLRVGSRLQLGDERLAASLRYLAEDQVVGVRSEEHTSELQSRENLVCRLLLEKKKEI